MANPPYELVTLGGLRLRSADGTLIGAPARKPLALLAIAGMAGDRGVSRHQIISLLWPDLIRSRASHTLSQTLYALRQELGNDVFFEVEQNLAVNPHILRIDAVEFREEIRTGAFEAAIARYQGPFLAGISFNDCDELDRWVAVFRAELAADHARLTSRKDAKTMSSSRSGEDRVPRARSNRSLRIWRRRLATVGGKLALLATVCLALVVGVLKARAFTLARQQQRYGGTDDDFLIARARELRERERTPRGRIFIETPVNHTGNVALDSIGKRWTSWLARLIDDGRIAYAVPRDTVVAVERESSRLGWKTPRQNLKLANAVINVMTVLTAEGDSVRLFVAVQRLRAEASRVEREYMLTLFRRVVPDSELNRLQSRRPASGTHASGVLESRPFAVLVVHRDDVLRESLRMARGLAGVFDEMRYCAMEKHAQPYSLPWCWMEENTVGLVKGYKHKPLVRWTNNEPLPGHPDSARQNDSVVRLRRADY